MTEKLPKITQPRGGPRPGSGRKKGSTNKLTAAKLLQQCELYEGPFEESLAADWANSKGNPELRFKYSQIILNKVMADQHHVEVDENSTTESRQLAFLKALETIGMVAIEQETVSKVDLPPIPVPPSIDFKE